MYHSDSDNGISVADQFEQRGGGAYHETPNDLTYTPDADGGSNQPLEDDMTPDSVTLTNLARITADLKLKVRESAADCKPHAIWRFGLADDGRPLFGWEVSAHHSAYVAVGFDADPDTALALCLADVSKERRKLSLLRAHARLAEGFKGLSGPGLDRALDAVMA